MAEEQMRAMLAGKAPPDSEVGYVALCGKYDELQERYARLEEELNSRNYACGDALDCLWKEIIYARHGEEYGDWEYAGQAYRHLIVEYEEQEKRLEHLRAANGKLLAACLAFLEEYEDVALERHFGQMLDATFANVLEPMYDAVREMHSQEEP